MLTVLSLSAGQWQVQRNRLSIRYHRLPCKRPFSHLPVLPVGSRQDYCALESRSNYLRPSAPVCNVAHHRERVERRMRRRRLQRLTVCLSIYLYCVMTPQPACICHLDSQLRRPQINNNLVHPCIGLNDARNDIWQTVVVSLRSEFRS